jgi:hypothetical protein
VIRSSTQRYYLVAHVLSTHIAPCAVQLSIYLMHSPLKNLAPSRVKSFAVLLFHLVRQQQSIEDCRSHSAASHLGDCWSRQVDRN